jgi:hypothetical protein
VLHHHASPQPVEPRIQQCMSVLLRGGLLALDAALAALAHKLCVRAYRAMHSSVAGQGSIKSCRVDWRIKSGLKHDESMPCA